MFANQVHRQSDWNRTGELMKNLFCSLIKSVASIAFFVTASPLLASETASMEGWSRVDEGQLAGEPYSLYEKSVDGSSTKAYRAECVFNASHREIFEAAMQLVVSPSEAPPGQDREVVRTGDDDFVVHTRIDVPLVTDRDINIRIERWQDESSGSLGLEWHATSEEGPRPQPGVVRISKADGFWRFSPLDETRTRVVYQNDTDIGGYVPLWVIGPMLREEALGQLSVLLRMVEEKQKARPASGAARSLSSASSER